MEREWKDYESLMYRDELEARYLENYGRDELAPGRLPASTLKAPDKHIRFTGEEPEYQETSFEMSSTLDPGTGAREDNEQDYAEGMRPGDAFEEGQAGQVYNPMRDVYGKILNATSQEQLNEVIDFLGADHPMKEHWAQFDPGIAEWIKVRMNQLAGS